MRGVVSAAMCHAIETLGLTASFDLVVGTSAGALNGSSLLNGTIGPLASNFHTLFTDGKYINPRHVLRGRSVVDTGGIARYVAPDFPAERFQRLLDHDVEFAAVVTDVESAVPVPLTDFADVDELKSALHASSLMPIVGGRPVRLRGRRMLDGGLIDAVPVWSAHQLDATHAVVLLTRPKGMRPGASRSDAIARRYLRRLNPALEWHYRRRPMRYARTVDRIEAGSFDGLATLPLEVPRGTPVPSRLESDPAVIQEAGRAAYEYALEVLQEFASDR